MSIDISKDVVWGHVRDCENNGLYDAADTFRALSNHIAEFDSMWGVRLNELEAAQKRIAELEAASAWQPIKDLPDEGWFIFTNGKSRWSGWADVPEGLAVWLGEEGSKMPTHFSHPLPLPTPPERG